MCVTGRQLEEIQIKVGDEVLNFVNDVKIRWNSTYAMIVLYIRIHKEVNSTGCYTLWAMAHFNFRNRK